MISRRHILALGNVGAAITSVPVLAWIAAWGETPAVTPLIAPTMCFGFLAALIFWFTRLDRSGLAVGSFVDMRAVVESVTMLFIASAVLGLVLPATATWDHVPVVAHWLVLNGVIAAPRALLRWRYRRWLRRQGPVEAPPEPVMSEGHPAEGPCALVISLTPVTDEPRVRRQCAALTKLGWAVVVAGYPGRCEKQASWSLIELENLPRPRTFLQRAALVLVRAASGAWPALAERCYWWSSGYEGMYTRIARTLERHPELSCRLIVANDYFTAPMADRLGRALGAEFVVDCHEHATSQYAHSLSWRLFFRPWVRGLERRFLPRAACVTTVCDGIAQLLERDYRLQPPPIVVRSTPSFVEVPFRACGETIEVLYHGILATQRGLEAAISSVPAWRPEFRLIIRGPGPEEYADALRRLAASCGAADRVDIQPPVLFDEMIPRANLCDIGYFAQEDISPQKRFTLPNKFFEYVMAGLALCVSDLPEMAKLVRQYDVGRLVPRARPDEVATVINSFDRASIDACKRRSLEAAQELCWERESERVLDAYARAARRAEDAAPSASPSCAGVPG
ncbi:MAG: glycosyltransferase [Planctomycetota bacterium]